MSKVHTSQIQICAAFPWDFHWDAEKGHESDSNPWLLPTCMCPTR